MKKIIIRLLSLITIFAVLGTDVVNATELVEGEQVEEIVIDPDPIFEGEEPIFKGEDDFIDLKEYGAKGDGVTDDTEAIRRAFEEAEGKEIIVPEGTYLLSYVPAHLSKVTIHGEGNPMFKKISPEMMPTFIFYDCDEADISGVTFDGGRETFGLDYDTAAIHFRGEAKNINIHDCRFQNFSRECTAFIGPASDVNISHNSYDTISALVWLKGPYIENLTFEYNEAVNGRYNGVELSASDSSHYSNVIVRHNTFKNFGTNVVQLMNISDIVMEDNEIDGAVNVLFLKNGDNDFVTKSCVLKGNRGVSKEFISQGNHSPCDTFELVGNNFYLQDGLWLNIVSNITMTDETYTLAPTGRISVLNCENLIGDRLTVEGETSSKECLLLNNVAHASISNSEFTSERPMFNLVNAHEKSISLNNISANFISMISKYINNPEYYESVVECKNNTDELINLDVYKKVISLPVVEDEFLVSPDFAEISQITGYVYEGRFILLHNSTSMTIYNTGNIAIPEKLVVLPYEGIALVYKNGSWKIYGTVEDEFFIDPSDVECSAGDNAVFSVSTNKDVMSYAWYKSIDGGQEWRRTYLNGFDTNEITVPVEDYMHNYLFKCEVKFRNGEEIVSQPGKIIIRSTPIVILKEPTDYYLQGSENAVFEVEASGENISYQWYKSLDDGATWVATYYEGFDTPRISVPVEFFMNTFQFKCVVSNKAGEVVESNAAKIISPSIEIVEQPEDVTCKPGDSVVFSIQTNGLVNSYQWYKTYDGGETWVMTYYPGFKTDEMTVFVEDYMDNYKFKCVITTLNKETIESDEAVITFE